MPVVDLSPFAGVGAQIFDNNGDPLTGGKIFSYAAGTTTPATTYTSSTGNTPHTNPIILDAAGRVPGGEIWLDYVQQYKFLVTTSANVLIASYDNIKTGFGSYLVYNTFTGNGVQTVFTLTASPLNKNAAQVYINGVYQQKNSYDLTSAVITFTEAPPATSTIEVNYL